MRRNRRVLYGLGMYGTLFIICLIGSLLNPMDPYHQITRLKNLPPSSSYLSVPASLDTHSVASIVSGLSFSVAISNDGALTAWGEGADFIDKKIDDALEIAAGDHHMVVLHKDHRVTLYSEADKVALPVIPSDEVIKHVYAYGDTIALLSNANQLYLSSISQLSYVQELTTYQSHIVDIALNDEYIALCLEDGSMQVFGDHVSSLSEVNYLSNVKDVVLSERIGLALHHDGTITLWGNEATQALPMNETYKEIAASADSVFALSTDGHVYACGENAFTSLSVPKATIHHIYADTYQYYATSDSTLYAWGNHGFPLGSDAYGRDLLTRLFHGGLWTMSIGLIAVITETILGTLIGLLAGYAGGWIDHFLMRLAEILSSIPFLPLMITLSAFLKDVLPQQERIIFVMVLYGILASPNLARIIRSQILAEREKDYVLSARLLGAGTLHILRYELLPQIAYLLLVNLTLSYADSILLESSLSFLGFGVAPPYPTWGNLLEHAQSTFVLEHCWWQWLFPALCILLCVLAIHMIGEGLRKQLDPKDVKQ